MSRWDNPVQMRHANQRYLSPWGQPAMPFLLYLRSCLRGVSQVFFITNLWTGLIFLAAISWNGWIYGVAAATGSLVATATAYLIGVPRADILAGLYGFNGTLVAICLPFSLGYGPPGQGVLWTLIIVGAAVSTLLQAGFVHLLNPYGIPAATGPFVLTGWLILAAAGAFSAIAIHPATAHLSAAHFPTPPQVGTGITLQMMSVGFFKGIGQVMFMDNVISGALVLLGIFIGNWQGGIMAAMGAAIGVVVPALLGANTTTVELGLFAFNPTLAAMAMGAIFSPFGWRSAAYGVVAALTSLLITPGVTAFAGLLGLPSLTAPFVVTVYLLVAARHVGKNL